MGAHSETDRLSILGIDDHPLTVAGIKEVLQREFGEIEFRSAATAGEGLQYIYSSDYSLVLLDLSLGGRNGLELLEEIRKHRPGTPVLVVSMHPEEVYAVRALKAGASGYLRKDAPMSEVIKAVHKVLAGGRYISDVLAQNLAEYLTNDSSKPAHERLSRREFEVLCFIGQGLGLKQIGAQLNLSIKTVSTYRTRILRELGLDSTAALIRYCIDQRLTTS